jgi:hypothetical protein
VSSVVVDPLGRANGLRNGKVVAQTPGATVRKVDGAIVVTLPNVPDGVFTTTVADGDTPVAVTTTVMDKDEEPVTVTSYTAATATGVEVQAGGDKPDVRTLSADETKRWTDANSKKSGARPTAQSAPRGGVMPEPTTRSQIKKIETPAPALRRSSSPAPTRR